MLTRHQQFHLKAVIADTVRHSITSVSAATVNQLAEAKEVDPKEWENYLGHVKQEAEAILVSGIFPTKLECPSDIHDYLEYDTSLNSRVIYG